MRYVIDIDGTLCTNSDGYYEKAQPYPKRIQMVNRFHAAGHVIVLYTARGMGRFSSKRKAEKEFRKLTESQLKKWGVSYTELQFGKPSADFYIDDKGMSADEFFASTKY